jgi:hypothetical protein
MATPQPQIPGDRTFVAKPISVAYLPPAGASTRARGVFMVGEQVRPSAYVPTSRAGREHAVRPALNGFSLRRYRVTGAPMSRHGKPAYRLAGQPAWLLFRD